MSSVTTRRGAEVERLVQRVGEERLGVAVAPQQRRGDAAPVELGAQPHQQLAVEVVDRAAPAAGEVVLADRLEPGVGDAAAGGDPAQEGHDLLGRLGAAEGAEQHDVVGGERIRGIRHGTAYVGNSARPRRGMRHRARPGWHSRADDEQLREPDMQDLRLIGVHEDGHHLLLADADGGRYRLTPRRGAASRGPPRPAPARPAADRDRGRAAAARGAGPDPPRPVRRGGRRPRGLDRREGAPLRGPGARRARARRPGRPEVRRRQPRVRPGDPRRAGVRAAARPWRRPRRRRVGLLPRRRGRLAADPDLRRRWPAAHRHLALRAARRVGHRHQRRGPLAERGGRAGRDPDAAPGRARTATPTSTTSTPTAGSTSPCTTAPRTSRST